MRWQRWLHILFTLLVVHTFVVVAETEPEELAEGDDEAEEEEEEENLLYFYLQDNAINEFEAPAEGEPDRPDFLYAPKPTEIRLVEFYAHWCPHCQHFRQHYMDFAENLEFMASKYHIDIQTYAVSCVPHKTICQDQGVTGYPKVKLFQAGSTNGTFYNIWSLHPFQILRHVGVELDVMEDEKEAVVDNNPNNQLRANQGDTTTITTTEGHFLKRTKKDIYNDAYLSFDFAMRNGIFSSAGPLTNKTRDDLKTWLYGIQSTVPPTWRLQQVVGDILNDIEQVAKAEANLVKILDQYPPKKKTWSRSCTRGDPVAGYTCGLWELFHISSVGLVEWNNMVTGDDWLFYRTEDCAQILRDFIEDFFGCEDCRLNFLQAFDSCAFDRCNRLSKAIGYEEDWREYPMWLFETHNAVNVRLMKERAKRENRVPTKQDEVNVLWPSREDCPTCWHSDGRWDQDKVYIFLRLTYWPEDGNSEEMRQELSGEKFEEEDDEEDTGEKLPWVFQLIPFVLVALAVGTWYKKQTDLIRTGRHKKEDG